MVLAWCCNNDLYNGLVALSLHTWSHIWHNVMMTSDVTFSIKFLLLFVKKYMYNYS